MQSSVRPRLCACACTCSSALNSLCAPVGHANLLNNVSNPSKTRLLVITTHYHSKIPLSLQGCYLSCCYPCPHPHPPSSPHPTPLPLSPSAVCTAAVGWKMACEGGLVQGCQQRHNRYTRSPSDTHCARFPALLCYFSRLLSFCLFHRRGKHTHTHTHTETHTQACRARVNGRRS